MPNLMPASAVFPLCYFPPIPWFVAAMQEQHIALEIHQHYRKQTFTSRTRVKGANGPLLLTVPVERRGLRQPIKDKRVANQENWQLVHWRSLKSAYNNTPFFEFYQDQLHPVFHKRYEFLLDLLMDSLQLSCQCLGIGVSHAFTTAYAPAAAWERDYREAFPTKGNVPPWFVGQPYPQLFGGFIAGLSVLDVLFNEGPQARLLLDACWAP